MQSAANGSRFGGIQAGSNGRGPARLLASVTFLAVGLAIGNWPTSVHAQTFPSTGTRALPTYQAT